MFAHHLWKASWLLPRVGDSEHSCCEHSWAFSADVSFQLLWVITKEQQGGSRGDCVSFCRNSRAMGLVAAPSGVLAHQSGWSSRCSGPRAPPCLRTTAGGCLLVVQIQSAPAAFLRHSRRLCPSPVCPLPRVTAPLRSVWLPRDRVDAMCSQDLCCPRAPSAQARRSPSLCLTLSSFCLSLCVPPFSVSVSVPSSASLCTSSHCPSCPLAP